MKFQLLVVVVSFAYAILRYNLAGEVSWAQLPLYIANKALAMSAVVCLLLAARSGLITRGKQAINWGKTAMSAALLHTTITLILLPAGYYPKLYQAVNSSGSESLNTLKMFSLTGNFALAFGVFCIYLFLKIGRCRLRSARLQQKLQMLLLASLAYHLIFIGGYGWLTPGKWNGYLPPVSLLSFVCLLCLIFLKKNKH